MSFGCFTTNTFESVQAHSAGTTFTYALISALNDAITLVASIFVVFIRSSFFDLKQN